MIRQGNRVVDAERVTNGWAEIVDWWGISCVVPEGTSTFLNALPALTRWATIVSPCGALGCSLIEMRKPHPPTGGHGIGPCRLRIAGSPNPSAPEAAA
jgi:hypothetical protein